MGQSYQNLRRSHLDRRAAGVPPYLPGELPWWETSGRPAPVSALDALDLFARLAPRHIHALFEAADVFDLRRLPPGIWLGRSGGGSTAYEWAMHRLFRRRYFAKLFLDGWGVHLPVRQDGSYRLLPARRSAGGVRVRFPFRIGWDSLDYGFHVLGSDFGPPPVQFQDEVRGLPLAHLADHLPPHLATRLRDEQGRRRWMQGILLVAFVAPLGIHRLRGLPFALVFGRPATAAERRVAMRHLSCSRLWDSSPGPLRAPDRTPAPLPAPSS